MNNTVVRFSLSCDAVCVVKDETIIIIQLSFADKVLLSKNKKYIFSYRISSYLKDFFSFRYIGNVPISWLAEEAVRRYCRVHPNSATSLLPSNANNNKPRVVEVRKTGGSILLDPEDNVVDVLDDNDFVNIRMENDLPESNAINGPSMNSHYDHSLSDPFIVPNKLDALPNSLTDNEIVLDGYHLTIKDLVLLSKGQTRIRLRKIAEDRVTAGRQLVEAILKENKVNGTINNKWRCSCSY